MTFGVVAIGRNEGKRLRDCLASLSSFAPVVYVDSGSTDGSAQWARGRGVEVVELDRSFPFTAARARNVGFARLKEMDTSVAFVQFVDGDCQLDQGWPGTAVSFLNSHPDVGAVCGLRCERYPEKTIYNWLSDLEWNGPVGQVRAFGGDVMIRTKAFETTNGYRDNLIAGEDPELSVRMRAAGWRIWRLDANMTIHDAAMTSFAQWWRHEVRSGYAFAQGAYLHGAPPEFHCIWETQRALLWGICLPLTLCLIGVAFAPWGWAASLVYPLHFLQKIIRRRGPLAHRALIALFHVLGHFPQSWGEIKFVNDVVRRRQARLIEYK